MTDHRCPCCGSSLPPLPLDAMMSVVSPTAATVLLELATRKNLSIWDLADRVYRDDPDGGPENANNGIQRAICIANRRWRTFGWEVRSKIGRGNSAYSIQKYEPEP